MATDFGEALAVFTFSSSCITFARNEESAIDELVRNGELSAAALRLIGRSVAADRREPAGGKKRRRSF